VFDGDKSRWGEMQSTDEEISIFFQVTGLHSLVSQN
jgi:hypothetical protein